MSWYLAFYFEEVKKKKKQKEVVRCEIESQLLKAYPEDRLEENQNEKKKELERRIGNAHLDATRLYWNRRLCHGPGNGQLSRDSSILLGTHFRLLARRASLSFQARAAATHTVIVTYWKLLFINRGEMPELGVANDKLQSYFVGGFLRVVITAQPDLIVFVVFRWKSSWVLKLHACFFLCRCSLQCYNVYPSVWVAWLHSGPNPNHATSRPLVLLLLS